MFVTLTWYGHLKYMQTPLFLAIVVSWGIALFEYALMLPANNRCRSAARRDAVRGKPDRALRRSYGKRQNLILPTRMSLNIIQSPTNE